MRRNILEKVSIDLLSVPPLIFRATRRRITKTTLPKLDVNITAHHFEIMRLLKEEGTLHVSQIGERLQIPKAQMTKLIDKLVALKIVERKMGKADRRTYDITITGQARKVLEEHKHSVMRATREVMSSLTDEELETLSVSLRNLRDILWKSIERNPKGNSQ
jgi:DNA-binding MarR family transcriptional regulator